MRMADLTAIHELARRHDSMGRPCQQDNIGIDGSRQRRWNTPDTDLPFVSICKQHTDDLSFLRVLTSNNL